MKKTKVHTVIGIIAIGFLLIFLVRTALYADYVVDGRSMEPTLEDGNKLMVNKATYDLSEIERFDVIVFHADAKDDYVKRVIGLPGDTIVYKDNQLFVNGKLIKEDFLEEAVALSKEDIITKDFTLKESTGEKEVPEGKIFVLGDNRANSVDSRKFGFISQEQVVGKVDASYSPPQGTRIGLNH